MEKEYRKCTNIIKMRRTSNASQAVVSLIVKSRRMIEQLSSNYNSIKRPQTQVQGEQNPIYYPRGQSKGTAKNLQANKDIVNYKSTPLLPQLHEYQVLPLSERSTKQSMQSISCYSHSLQGMFKQNNKRQNNSFAIGNQSTKEASTVYSQLLEKRVEQQLPQKSEKIKKNMVSYSIQAYKQYIDGKSKPSFSGSPVEVSEINTQPGFKNGKVLFNISKPSPLLQMKMMQINPIRSVLQDSQPPLKVNSLQEPSITLSAFTY
ncbi:hypothetical protein FGO68_gene16495 [Halteria grandinella]|uniref:Uncharacterized protein n=1 Tax=Halteria grandinella TaxID=5974 RepID=A0A8J8NSS9_HALGN|nr:hypothetical protein FGO68_gene16495 [Halteria grandinella]